MKKYAIPPAVRRIIEENVYRLSIVWSISRARDTYGQNRASLWITTPRGGRYRVASYTGGGRDLPGACLGAWIMDYKLFKPGLIRLPASRFYGLTFYDEKAQKSRKQYHPGNKIIIDGKCGLAAMEKILAALGFYLVRTENRVNYQVYDLKSF